MKKLLIIGALLVIGGGGAYKLLLAKPGKPAPKPKVDGLVYMLPKAFVVDLKGGRYAKVGVGLEVSRKHPESLTPNTGESSITTPEGYGVMPEEAFVREVVTSDLTGLPADDLLVADRREALKARIMNDLMKQTDVKLDGVLFSDVTVQ